MIKNDYELLDDEQKMSKYDEILDDEAEDVVEITVKYWVWKELTPCEIL